MTPGWAETYLGLIVQVHGLAFFVLGVAALLFNMRRDTDTGLTAHLGWLAAFGMLYGLQKFVDGERLHNPAAWLVVLGTALMITSFAALLEFGRRLWNERPAGRRLGALPLYAAAGAGILALMLAAPAAAAGLELGARYLLGAPGAALTGIGLFAQARTAARAPDTIVIVRWLHLAALAMLGYAVLTLFLSPGSGRLLADWLPTTANFLATTGLPVQLARALCAVLLAAAFLIINRQDRSLTVTTLRRVTDRLDGFVYRCRNDRNWTVTFMSEGGENLTGYPASDFQRGERHFADQMHPDDQERVWNEVQAALAQRAGFRLQYRMIDRAGRIRWCYEEGRGIFDAKGELLYLEGLVRNDDERHQAEVALAESQSHYRKLFELSTDGIVYADAESKKLATANSSFADMLGYPLTEIAQLSVQDVHPPDALPWVLEQFDQLASRQKTVVRDIPVLRRDGSVFYADISAILISVSGKNFRVANFRDASQRRMESQRIKDLNATLEARVRERTAQLERANSAKNDFLSRMSHELRTPLNAILGFTQLLQLPARAPLSTQQADYVGEIHHAGKHLLSLVNEVLDIARIEAGQLEINPEPVALTPPIEQSMAQIKIRARDRGIRLTLHAHNPCVVLADPLRLRQVLLNLLSNAVKYNREDGQIEVEYTLAPNERVRVNVRDTGHGLSAEQLARLFRPFERLESAYEGIEGTGIGLALAKQLVECMDGTIGVDSTPGAGSTFWFELPLASEKEQVVTGEVPQSAASASAKHQGKKRSVLYVEDNPANLRLVQKILGQRNDIELFSATSAEEGIATARRLPPDLILLDINLPDMDGFMVLKHLQADPATRTIPVIAVSANAMSRDIERGEAEGFQAYITKPIDVSLLLGTIDEHLFPSSDTHE